jgi:hypothetical protein
MIDFGWFWGSPIRQSDDEHRLVETGYHWHELSHDMIWVAAATFVSALYLSVAYYSESNFKAALPFAAVAAIYSDILLRLLLRRRTVVFRRDGSVRMPYGRPNKIGVRKLRIDHASIASIETTRECEGTGVAIYTVDGQTIIVSHKLRPSSARLVAVQLTKALHELRDSIATVGSTRSAFYAQIAAV